MKVFWTKFALDSLSDIYKYYKDNVSETIAGNIRESILASAYQLQIHPSSAAMEELLLDLNEGHRYIIRGNYKIIYKIRNQKVFITDVFDSRQSPEKITKRNK